MSLLNFVFENAVGL